MPHTLNQGQQEAFDAFFAFLMSTDPFFVISGPAGVGKTFLMNHLSNAGLKHYENACTLGGITPLYDQVVFTATTNKAAEVLSESIGKPVSTIHSYLNLKVYNDYSTGKSRIEKNRNWHTHHNTVLFIDETSMVDQALLNFLFETMKSSKIVFVGDHAQMAPINADLSPIYATVPSTNFAVLTEPVRNADTLALIDLCTQLRNTVETGVFAPMAPVPGVVDYLDDDSMPAELHTHFADLNPSARVLCYTNERTQEFNEFIREDVRGLSSTITEGDIFVVASTYQRGKTNFPVEFELEAVKVGPIQYDTDHADILNGDAIAYRLCDFRFVGGLAVFEGIRVAENRNVVDYVIKAYGRRKNWSSYFDLKAAYIDLRDKAACTVYKSQGSTYDTVFIDIGNIGTSHNAQQVARMLYVAVSRARYRVCFYGRLANRYFDSQGVPLWTATTGLPGSSISSDLATKVA